MGRLSGLSNRFEDLQLRDRRPTLPLSARNSRVPIDRKSAWGKKLVAAFPNATHLQHGDTPDVECCRTGCSRKLDSALPNGSRSAALYEGSRAIASFCCDTCMHREAEARVAPREPKRKRHAP